MKGNCTKPRRICARGFDLMDDSEGGGGDNDARNGAAEG